MPSALVNRLLSGSRDLWARGGTVLRLAVALLLLVAVCRWVVSPAQLLAAARAADPRWLALAVGLLPVGLALQWWKWRALVRPALPDVTDGDVLGSLLAGFALGLCTPGRLGEVGRGLVLPGHRRQATVLAAVDRGLSAAVTLASGAVAAWLVAGPVGGGVGGLAVLTLVGATVGAWRILRARRGSTGGAWWQVAGGLPGSAWARNLLGAVLFNLVFWGQFYCLLRAGEPLPASAAAAIPAVFALKTLLPISFMDLGVREGAAAMVLAGLGVTTATAVNAALALFLINVLLPGVAGWLHWSHARRDDLQLSPHPQGVELAHVR